MKGIKVWGEVGEGGGMRSIQLQDRHINKKNEERKVRVVLERDRPKLEMIVKY